MNNFISNIISRHIGAQHSVVPRLRSRFEPMDTSPNNSQPEFTTSKGRVEQIHQDKPETILPVNNMTGKRENNMTPIDIVTPAWIEHNNVLHETSTAPVNTAPVSTANEQSKNASPGYLQTPEKQHDKVVSTVDEKKETLKENTIVVDHFHNSSKEIIHETKEEKIVSAAVPVTTRLVKPFTSNNELKNKPEKFQGILGEPPSAKNFNNSNSKVNAFTNYQAASDKPVIKISIGQVNVRAVSPQPLTIKKQRTVQQPALSLENYLKQRSKGE